MEMTMFKRRFYAFLDSSNAGEGSAGGAGAAGAGGDGGGQGGAGAGAAGAGGDNGAASGASGAPSALAAGASAAGGAGGGAPGGDGAADPFAWIPEKHRVVGPDGKTLDLEASARKVTEAYGHLEKRLGTGDVPPKTPGEYKVTVPDSLKDKINADDLAKADDFQGFLGKLHGAGLSQSQADVVIAEMLERGAKLRETMPAMDAAECVATLREADGWKTDAEYSKQIGLSFQAGKSIFGADFDAMLKDYGNDPRFIRGLAAIGKEIVEDRPAPPEAQAQLQESLDQIMNSTAYMNPNDPQHAATVAKVTALTARMAGQRAVASGKTISFKSA